MTAGWGPAVLAQQPSGLFVEVAPAAPPAGDQRVVTDRTTVRVRTVRIDFPRLGARDARPGAGATVELNLFDDVSYVAVRDRIDSTAHGFVWIGHIRGVELSTVTLATENGVMSGSIQTPDAAYAIRSAGAGLHAILQIDPGAFPPEAEPPPVSLPTAHVGDQALDELQGDTGSLIDVMVLYTPAAAAAAGGTSAINALIASAISITNTSYINSNVAQRLRLVHSQPVDYTESGDIQADLRDITQGAGSLGGVAALRNLHAADLVTLLTETPAFQWCGVAWAMTTVSTQFASHGFSVVEQRCAVAPLSFAHELGHNMGLRHDWFVDDGTTPYSYAHGHVNAGETQSTQWRTIMAYADKCAYQGKSCPRLAHWSNPSVAYLGTATGVPEGTGVGCSPGNLSNPPCDADEHRALNNSAFAVANFRQSAQSVVSLLANVAMPVIEGTGITWTATMSGGSAAVEYQFFRLSDEVWSEAQPYGPSNSYTWFPSAGTHAVQVWVRNSGSEAAYDTYVGTGTFVVLPRAKLQSLIADVSFPVQYNLPITFTANATGSVEYKFLMYSSSSGWRMGQDYSTSNSFTWYPPVGLNAVQVWMRTRGSASDYDDWLWTGLFSVAGAPARLTGFSANVPLPASPATTITWTATASAQGFAEYKFFRQDRSTAGWTVLRDWSGDNQASWTPGVGNSGWHALQVWVRTAGSSVAYEDWLGSDYFLVTAATGITLDASRPLDGLREGSLVTWTANVTGGTGPWEYEFFTYDHRGWLLQQSYSAENSFSWYPPAGTCTMQVWIRAAGSHALWERYASAGMFVVDP
jgi:hypothetical protein